MKKLKFNIDWKRAFRIGLRILILSGFLASVGFTEHRRSSMVCNKIVINIDDSLGNSFVQQGDIEKLIRDKFGKIEGNSLTSINISLLEKIIDGNPFVLKAQVFSTVDGNLIVEVKQRTPLVRVINTLNESFYIDDNGVFMPMSDKFSAHVPVANGNIFNRETEQRIRKITEKDTRDTTFSPTLLEKIFMVCDYTHNHEFWNAQIEQVFINASGEIELIPRVGKQTILFGNEKDIEEKFSKLYTLYREGFSKTGWNQYKTINVTFKDQVVCSK